MSTISVIMSIYKEPIDWIRQSIDSILGQSYSDFEFIIVCDNPDYQECLALLNKYAKEDYRIKLITNDYNIGLTKSLNKALNIAKGVYIARMDADDISLPNRFEEQVAFMEAHPNCVASGAFARIIDGNGKIIGHWKTKCSWKDLKSYALFVSPILHPTAFFKRVNDEEAIRYDESKRYAQDYALWGSLIAKNEILNINKLLLLYRQTQGQISSKHFVEQANCAIQTQSKILDEFRLSTNPEIKEAIAIVTKKQKEESNVLGTYNALVSFVEANKENDVIDMPVIKLWLFRCFAQYLRYQTNLFEANRFILSFSKMIKTFNLRSYLVMNYSLIKRLCNN